MTDELEFDRRVYKRELKRVTGWGDTWIRTLEKRGAIPAGHVDEGGKRKWWLASEVQAILAGTAATVKRGGTHLSTGVPCSDGDHPITVACSSILPSERS